MPYTMEDFRREFKKEALKILTPDERLDGLSPETLLQRLSPEVRLEGLSPETLLARLTPEEIENYLKRLKDRSPAKS